MPRKAAVLLKFSTKSQLSAFKGVQFPARVACPPQAKQRDEVISQPVTQHVSQRAGHSPGVIFPFGSRRELLLCCHFGFHYSCFFVLEWHGWLWHITACHATLFSCENRKLGAYVGLYKTNCSVLLSCAVPLYFFFLWNCTAENDFVLPSKIVLFSWENQVMVFVLWTKTSEVIWVTEEKLW